MRPAFFLALALAAAAFGEDPVSALAHRLEQSAAQLPFDQKFGYLPALLDALHVPLESQMAVFSKTSIQSMIIQPSNPRILYFNDAVSVGWVRSGFIEMAAQDPGHGINYYVLLQRPDARITPRHDCLKCHHASALLLKSVTPDPTGYPTAELDIDTRTPFAKLWGGWFVTGPAIPRHQGNAVFEAGKKSERTLDPKFALTPSSDAAALLVFAHQMRVMNLLANPENPNELAGALLFQDEAKLPAPIAGSSEFAQTFASQGPKDRQGRSLRDLDLYKRLFRYPCSYMIYSEAFDALPSMTKEAVYRRMKTILAGIPSEDREAIAEILRDTKPGFPH